MKKNLLLIFSVLVLISCEKYIDMEIPDRGRKLVANCLYSDTGGIVVNLAMSRFILDNSDFLLVSGATVIFYENGIAVDTLTEIMTGKYKSNGFISQAGATHSLKIIKGEDQINASSSIPYPVPFEFIDTMRVANDYSESLRFRIKLNDPANTDNFYMINFERPEIDTTYYSSSNYYFYTNEPFIEEQYNSYGIFSDILFKGQSRILSFDLDLYGFTSEENIVKIVLYSLSEDMYHYLKTYQAQQNVGNSPFAEPVMVYNNIENGYGIFGGFSISSDTIIIPQLYYGWDYIE